MNNNELFAMALGLGKQWEVVGVEFEGEPKKLKIKLDFVEGTKFACPECGLLSPVHDTRSKKWRHLNFFQYECELEARVPRVKCPEHGVHQIDVPWARPGSGFTVMFEAMAMLLATEMSVSQSSEMLAEHDTRIWSLVLKLVGEAQKKRDWSGVRRIMVDETQSKKGHRYVTNFVDADTKELLFMAEGKGAETFTEFKEELRLHGGDPGQIEWIAMDMSRAFICGAAEQFPEAEIAFDFFHIMKLAGEALDKVRKEHRREGAELMGGHWALRGNEWNRTEEQKNVRRELCEKYPKLGKAVSLREALHDALKLRDLELLKWWMGWARRCRLEPFVELARTLKNHWDGILGYIKTGMTNAAMEAINKNIQLAKRIAHGFSNFKYFQACAYLKAAHLNFNLPRPCPSR